MIVLVLYSVTLSAQYWQQKVEYKMDISMDEEMHQYQGKQSLTYYNHSPDTLFRVFYHLYYNAFQPGSMMDVRSQQISDPEKDIAKIKGLAPDEIGYIHVTNLYQDKMELEYKTEGTILTVYLDHPLLPGKKTLLTMEYEAQIPLYVRRTGRDNKEGIAFSMAQWYPKLCEYDRSGWHADPYIGKEFYGVWGDYDVKINIASDYILGGTGKIMNAKEVKNGYDGIQGKPEGNRATWHFIAKNVHDFVWAADKDYIHEIVKVNEDLDVHLLFKNDSTYEANWIALSLKIPRLFNFANARFGKYAYDNYYIIQGGDRGMEYPMATLMNGNRTEARLLGTVMHELMHEWYYFALATNESAYAWMDEGFTSYADEILANYMTKNDSLSVPDFNYARSRAISLIKSDLNEPLITHSDHYASDRAYSINVYNKGAMYLHELAYVIGQDKLDQTLLRYFNEWSSKHPQPEDFIRVAEKVSDMELSWYNDYYVYSTKKLDYGIKSVYGTTEETRIILERLGDFILPVDLEVSLKNGAHYVYNIPLEIMRGHKENQGFEHFETLKAWPWVNPEYVLDLPFNINDVLSLAIDPQQMTLDVDRENNFLEIDLLEDTGIYIGK